ncbi:tRNA-uridine aminocarboxypropyltransferase [Halioxenophilus sp. WMMB6]|uniref:tRNA-uridine aminocarboxypropyltransferase n=1 Tax=Halioxenophilus sp. WMMB6 TaxID=3073815 RepID=UPI00295E7050|nr:DTW domain-containing protein [Halioxenophilus sp. WMMB6]
MSERTAPPLFCGPPAELELSCGSNAFQKLRQQRQRSATRPFLARGHRVVRCPRCQLNRCICHHRQSHTSEIDFLLLMHRNEVLKPTNTGSLVADCFPANTWAATWHRTQPPAELLQLLDNGRHRPLLLFPGELNPVFYEQPDTNEHSDSRWLLVVIDATWKQARKMYLQSPWLQTMPTIRINAGHSAAYHLRQAVDGDQLSTAEAVAYGLDSLNQPASAQHLRHYFGIFNQHYLAMRRNLVEPVVTHNQG